MKNSVLKYVTLGILTLLISVAASAQSVYELKQEKSKILLSGTSNIHDWEMEVEKFRCKVILQEQTTGGTLIISQIDFESSVDDIKSENKIMDSKTHKALKEDEYPIISFILEEAESVSPLANSSIVSGKLTIAGNSREIGVPVQINYQGKEKFMVTGEVSLKMSDFGIEPPTAMLGALKTSDEVSVKYNFKFSGIAEDLTQNK